MALPSPSQPHRPATREGLLVWFIHRFAEEFDAHAVLKGGMALRLLESPRHTNDLDYVFVPYESKKEVLPVIKQLLAMLPDAEVRTTLHSTMIRAEVRLDDAAIQIEISVSPSCVSIPIATAPVANAVGVPSQVVRILAPDVALAHKLAAWNERRLLRDLYDAYYLAARARAVPDRATLQTRLDNVQSRLPHLRRRKRMTSDELVAELKAAMEQLTDSALEEELHGLVEPMDLAGLALRIQATLLRLLDQLAPAR